MITPFFQNKSVQLSSFLSHPPALNSSTKSQQTISYFQNLIAVKILSKAKFPVYLVSSKLDQKYYAMKVFDYTGTGPQIYFENEIRFSFLHHPNIIKTHYTEHEKQILSKGTNKKVCYIIMEYAPYGNFLDFMMNHAQNFDEKLIRTYFRQLIEGLKHLHKIGVSHLDLKFENLLLGKDLNLKITDFDLSFIYGDLKILSRGTKFYRAPELIQGQCQDTQAADIYSAGIILFALKTGGMLPHAEDECIKGVDFASLLYSYNEEFWAKHCEVQKKSLSFFDEDFKNLFNAMVNLDPNKRPSIKQIKQARWYSGSYYTDKELKIKVEKMFSSKSSNS